MKKITLFVAILLICLIVTVYFFNEILTKNILLLALRPKFGNGIQIGRACLNRNLSIRLRDVTIIDKAHASFSAGSGIMRLNRFNILKMETGITCTFSDAIITFESNSVMGTVFSALSITGPSTIEFNSLSGDMLFRPKAYVLHKFVAEGPLIRITARGANQGKNLDYDISLQLSESIASEIPEAIKKVFLPQDGLWHEVELKIYGDVENPSINFNTALFSLSIK